MSPYRTHFLYLRPSDRPDTARDSIQRAALHLQAWYYSQMGNRKTFTLANGIVQTCLSQHEALWFSTNNAGGSQDGWFWANTLNEAANLAGAGLNQPFDTWVIYIDAPLAPRQYVGGTSNGGYSGVAVLPEQDVRAVQGLDQRYTLCREIGGCGHELGHTFGLPHPDMGDPQYNTALMGAGYAIYPRCILTQAAKDQLNLNPMFSVVAPKSPPAGLCPFGGRVAPTPRPMPLPHARPQ